ncbi:MAG: aminotransferase class V-fold PLP-dependent enzyme, partial [Candidatus Omnitrophica bacterium]|nr:aminotransferase class V-fold PLP-dependent enzyme [Candidatus Omnitrophota bacterium]
HISLYELGIGSGDEVIVPALTFIATVNPVIYTQAKPVFADVDIDTWNISPEELEKRITKKTKAIIPVHLYGNPCEMDKIMAIARKHKLHVIEDATESLGAVYNKKHTGTFGDLGCFSFNGNKTITTGGGGMVVSNNKKRIEHIKFLINQARDESKGYYHPELGFNYRMTNIEAALGLAQFEKLEAFLNKKKDLNETYKENLGSIPGFKFQVQYLKAKSSFWLTTLRFENNINVETLQKKLRAKGIPVRRVFMPLTEFPHYKNNNRKSYKNAYRIYNNGLCLPSSVLNSREDALKVCKAIKEVL